MEDANKENTAIKALLLLLVLSAFASAIGSVSLPLSLSQIFTVVLFLCLIYFGVQGAKVPVLFSDDTSRFIYLYFLSNVLASVLFSGQLAASLKACAVILGYLLVYTATRGAMRFVLDKAEVIHRLTQFNGLSVIFGLVCMVVAMFWGTGNIGVSYEHLSTAGKNSLLNAPPSIRSLSLEPNLFSVITGTILCLQLTLYFWRKSWGQMIMMVLAGASILFAYTRSVYIGLAAAVLMMVVLSKERKLMLAFAKYATALVVLILVLVTFLPKTNSVRMALMSRASTLTDFKSGTGLGRAQIYQIGLKGFEERPLLGNGTLTANTTTYNKYKRIYQERGGSPGWLTGLWIQSLHDTGLIGFGIVIGMFASLFYSNYKVFSLLHPLSREKAIVLGFLGGNLVILITAQLSSTLWVAFPWIYWGINLSYLQWCREKVIEKS